MKALRSIFGQQDRLLVGLVLILLVAVVIVQPSFLHVETAFTVIRAAMVPVLFGLAVLIVLISGGIDVSFLAVGIFSAYVTCTVIPVDSGGPFVVLGAALLSTAVGVGLGVVNAIVVLITRVPVLIATLATSAIYTGVLFAFVGGVVINRIPEGLAALGRIDLMVVEAAQRGVTRLNVLVIVVIVVCVLLQLFLRFTVRGRRLFALGGDVEASRRLGLSVAGSRIWAFALAGGLSGLAGILHVALSGRADPTTFFGGELDVLAAVVLGGAAITGGVGSVRGTVIGVLAIEIITIALIPLGVPPIWQKAVVGALLLIGVGLQSVAQRVAPPRPILSADDPALARPIRTQKALA